MQSRALRDGKEVDAVVQNMQPTIRDEVKFIGVIRISKSYGLSNFIVTSDLRYGVVIKFGLHRTGKYRIAKNKQKDVYY